ncbi:MAG: DUF2232 domain-containing protein [Nitrospirota bacterium]
MTLPANPPHKQRLVPGPAVLALVITVSFLFIPVLGAFMMMLLPAPIGYVRVKNGLTAAISVSALCIAVGGLAGGFPVVTAVTFALCVCGLSLGGSAFKQEPDDRAVLKGTVIPILALALLLGAYFVSAGINPGPLLDKALAEGLDESVKLYAQMGMSRSDIDAIMPSLKLFVRIITDYLPAIAVATMASVSSASWLLLKRHCARRGIVPVSEKFLQQWRAPDLLVWGIIVPGFLMIPELPWLRLIAGNVLFCFAIVYLFQGLAVLNHFFDRLGLSPVLRTIGYLVIALQPFLIVAIWALGFFDTWADFRKIRPKRVA